MPQTRRRNIAGEFAAARLPRKNRATSGPRGAISVAILPCPRWKSLRVVCLAGFAWTINCSERQRVQGVEEERSQRGREISLRALFADSSEGGTMGVQCLRSSGSLFSRARSPFVLRRGQSGELGHKRKRLGTMRVQGDDGVTSRRNEASQPRFWPKARKISEVHLVW